MKIRKRSSHQKCNFRLLSDGEPWSDENVTSASVIIRVDQDRILGVDLTKRGWDIPGGHREEGKESIIETLRRETREEANAEIHSIRLKKVIESDYYGSAPDELTYLLIYEAELASLGDFYPNDEVRARIIATPEEIIANHRGNKDLIGFVLR